MTTGTTPTAATLKGTSTVRARCGGALATLALVLGVLWVATASGGTSTSTPSSSDATAATPAAVRDDCPEHDGGTGSADAATSADTL